MNPLQQALADADENYFIGISNKGIYKRACKDLEEADISVSMQDDQAEIQISGETCLIKIRCGRVLVPVRPGVSADT